MFDPEVTRCLAESKKMRGVHEFGSLTGQERRLLAEVAKGKTDKEVATALGLTTKTARNYLDRVFAKLHVHTRTEAALLYTRCVEGPKKASSLPQRGRSTSQADRDANQARTQFKI